MKFISNIDTICVLVNIENYEENNKSLFNYLSEEKEKAKVFTKDNTNYKHIILLNDINFQLLSNACRGYAFIIRNNDYEIKIAQFKSKIEAFYPIQVRISSELLWSKGIIEAWSIIYNWIVETFGNIIADKVCRLDLACHISNFDFITNYDNVYKGNFRKRQVFHTNKEINSLCFGSRKNDNIYCRIYNKSLEIQENKKKFWFVDIWEKHGLNKDNVWNIEFEIKSEFFRKFNNLSSVSDVYNSLADIWEYCTNNWLIKIDRTNKRVERCNINKEWLELQNCYNCFKSRGLIERDKQNLLDANKLIPNIAGNIITYSSLTNEDNINFAFSDILDKSRKYLENKNTTFEREVNNKIKLLNN